MKIIISHDHAGFEDKRELIPVITGMGYDIEDLGPNEYNLADDYPDFIAPAMKRVQETPNSIGIIMCRNGVGVSMLANKFKGIRAALCFDRKQAVTAKTDDNANVLALPSDFLTNEEVLEIIQAFMDTDFSGHERHKRRLEKVAQIEEENFK